MDIELATIGQVVVALANWATANIGEKREMAVLSVWGQKILFFSVFIFYAWFSMLLKGMGESFIVRRWAANSQYWWSYGTLNL